MDTAYVKELKAAAKEVKRRRERAACEFFEKHATNLKKRSLPRDMAGFYQHMQGLVDKGKQSLTSQTVEDEDGRLLPDPAFILQRRDTRFHNFRNTKSTTHSP